MNGHTIEKNSSSASTSFTFTQEQCQQFLAMLGTNSTSMAGNFPSLQNFHSPDFSCDLRHSIFSEKKKRKWLVDMHMREMHWFWVPGLQMTLCIL